MTSYSLRTYLMQIITILILLIQPANALIECEGYGYKIIRNNPASIYQIDPNDPSPTTFMSNIDIRTTSMGYSLQHGLFFAIDNDDNYKLKSIDEDGDVSIVRVNGITTDKFSGVILDISYDGYIYINNADNKNKSVHKVQLSSDGTSATYIKTIDFTDGNGNEASAGSDIAIHPTNGKIYTYIKGNKIRVFDADSGDLEAEYTIDFGSDEEAPNGNSGSQWFDGQNRLYAWMNSKNSSDDKYHLYRFSFPVTGTVASGEDLGAVVDSNGDTIEGFGDGGACPAGLALDKDVNTTSAKPGDTVRYTFTIRNDYQLSIDVNLSDTMPENFDINESSIKIVGANNNPTVTVDKSSSKQKLDIKDIDINGTVALPVGTKEVVITVDVKIPDTYASGVASNQAILNNIPAIFGTEIKSDSNRSTTNPDETNLTIENVAPVATENNVTASNDNNLSGNVISDDNGDGKDFDANGDDLNVTGFRVDGTNYAAGATADIAGKGKITVDSNGSYLFEPDASFSGDFPAVEYQITDNHGHTDANALNIKVTDANNAPTATDDEVSTDENTQLSGNVISDDNGHGKDSDPDGDTLSVTKFTDGTTTKNAGETLVMSEGNLTINSDGSFTFDPAKDYTGSVPDVTYYISDGKSGNDDAKLKITVNSVNHAPVVDSEILDQTNNDNDSVNLDISGNFSDPDGDTLTFSATNLPAGLSIDSSTGKITGTIDNSASQSGPYDVTITAKDPGGKEVSDTFKWTVNNPSPTATDNEVSTNENTQLSGNVISDDNGHGKDSDPDGDTLSVTTFTDGTTTKNAGETLVMSEGNLTINSNGSFTFDPAKDYDGSVPDIRYYISDGEGGSDDALLKIKITNVNKEPVANDDSNTTKEDTVLNVPASSGLLSNDSDPDGDDINVTSFNVNGSDYSVPAGGSKTVEIPDEGNITIHSDGSYSFSPVKDFNGDVKEITYTVSDGNGGENKAKLQLKVEAVNDAPVVDTTINAQDNNDSDKGISLDISGNFSDPDGDTLTYSATNLPAGLSIDPTSGLISGDLEHNASQGGNNGVYDVNITAKDPDGESVSSIFKWSVTNIAPVAIDNNLTRPEDQDIKGNVITDDNGDGIDKDEDNDTLVVTKFKVDIDDDGNDEEFNAGDEATIANVGKIKIESDGNYTFTPETNYNGDVPTITYELSDQEGGTDNAGLNLHITAQTDAIIDDNEKVETNEDEKISGNLFDNLYDSDSDSHSITKFNVNGKDYKPDTTVELNEGNLTINSDGTYIFVPTKNYNGDVPTVTYYIVDDGDSSDTDSSTLDIKVKATTDALNDENEEVSTIQGSSVSGNVLDNVTDDDSNQHSVTTFKVNGTEYTAGESATIDNVGTITINSNGEFTFIPEDSYHGDVPSISYTVVDDNDPNDTDVSILSIKVEEDTDGDGVPNSKDLDDDNDGIPDTVEEATAKNGGDTDGDGIPDTLDLDSDNDGITDLEESNSNPSAVDSDGDGVLDSTTDADKDGLMDSADADDNDPDSKGTVDPIDTDRDGTPDFQDIDSDNDGLSDLVEGGTSADLDKNNDGMLDDDSDSDQDGIADSVDPDNGGVLASTPDTDGDGVDDYRDLDSDNDGLNDVEEANGTDANGDGLDDTPNESLANPLTDDTDGGNGTPDALEPNNPNLPGTLDADGDGVIDDITDTDGDGIPDVVDGNENSFADAPFVDSDGDGIYDQYDIDDDNDGIPDLVEEKGDPNRDTDGDGIPDRLDLDSDNDGILDIIEAGGVDSDRDGRVDNEADNDNDGLADVVDKNPDNTDEPSTYPDAKDTTLLPIPDTDSDGKPDFQDVDSDNDGISDLVENGGDASSIDPDNNGMNDGSVDENGIPTDAMNNELQDADSDGVPNYRDLDSDNDGLTDISEADASKDTDGNGLIDNANEIIIASTIPDQDGDGILDPYEPNNENLPGYVDENGDGMVDDPTDSDGDGIPDQTDGEDDSYGHEQGLHATHNEESVEHYGAVVVDVLANGDTYTVLSEITYTNPIYGTVDIDDGGTPDNPTDDVIIYTPKPDTNYITDEFTYTIKDAEGRTSEATVTLYIKCASSQKSDNGDSFNLLGMLMMVMLTILGGVYFIRKEENGVSL